MSWSALIGMGVTLRPFENAPRSGGTPSPFNSPLGSTLEILGRELDFLRAKRIVLQVGYREADLRLDGMPRANARMIHDAVALSFESRWGPLRYETNEFDAGYRRGAEGWQANLRAIALGMEALRKVDRYGVSKRGEQYQGWRAIPQSTDPADQILTADQARQVLWPWMLAGAPDDLEGALKRAVKATHPDRGGTDTKFREVMRAKEVLGL